VPVKLIAILDRLATDELEQLAAAAELAGLTSAAMLIEDLADRAGVLESRAEPGAGVPWEQLEAQASVNYRVTWSEKARPTRPAVSVAAQQRRRHLRSLDAGLAGIPGPAIVPRRAAG